MVVAGVGRGGYEDALFVELDLSDVRRDGVDELAEGLVDKILVGLVRNENVDGASLVPVPDNPLLAVHKGTRADVGMAEAFDEIAAGEPVGAHGFAQRWNPGSVRLIDRQTRWSASDAYLYLRGGCVSFVRRPLRPKTSGGDSCVLCVEGNRCKVGTNCCWAGERGADIPLQKRIARVGCIGYLRYVGLRWLCKGRGKAGQCHELNQQGPCPAGGAGSAGRSGPVVARRTTNQ